MLYIEQENEQYCVKAGQFIIIYPEVPHRGFLPCNSPTDFQWVHFYTTGSFHYGRKSLTDVKINRGNPQVYYQKKPFHLSLPKYGTVPEMFRYQLQSLLADISMVKEDKYCHSKKYLKSDMVDFERQLSFTNLIAIIFREYNKASRSNRASEEVRDYLLEHYKENVSITRIAESLSYSASHLIRYFKKDYQLTPLQFVTALRIRDSLSLLKDTDKPIYEIGEEIGFNSSAYFIKQFKSLTGHTPSEFRKAPTYDFRLFPDEYHKDV